MPEKLLRSYIDGTEVHSIEEITTALEEIIHVGIDPFWGGYNDDLDEDFLKEKKRFIKQLSETFSMHVLNLLYDAMIKKARIHLSIGDVCAIMRNAKSFHTKEYPEWTFDPTIDKNSDLIIICYGAKSDSTDEDIMPIIDKYVKHCSEKSGIIWGYAYSKKKGVIIIQVHE